MKQPKQFSTVKQQNMLVPNTNGGEINITETDFSNELVRKGGLS